MENWLAEIHACGVKILTPKTWLREIPSSRTKASNQTGSLVALAKALYSASVLERGTMASFRAVLEIKLGP
jgi:hypothetical protein